MDVNPDLIALKPEFCAHAARVMSFKSKKTNSKASRWPHPPSFLLTPEILASAGYFYDPADGEPDRTTCWMCGESMKGWAEDDDPCALHLKWSPNCPFARLAMLEHERDIQKPSWSESPNQKWGTANEWFPRGQVLIEARLATFCGPDGPWKHEGKQGIPTRLELARAGFHFTPNLFKKGRKFDVDDTTSCCYCNRRVTEWEVDDDPVSVHLKKGACIFFTAVPPTDPPQAKQPNTKSTRKPSRTVRSTAVVIEVETNTTDQHNSNLEEKKPSSTISNSTKTTGRRLLASSTSSNVAPEKSGPEPELSGPNRTKQTRATRKLATSTNGIASSPEPLEQTISKPPVALTKSTRLSRSTSKPPPSTASQRSTTSDRKTSLRVSSNISSALDHIQQISNSTSGDFEKIENRDEPSAAEESISVPKKQSRQRKPSKIIKASSPATSDKDYIPRSSRQIKQKRAKAQIGEESFISNMTQNSRMEGDSSTTVSPRVAGKVRARVIKTTALEAQPQSPPQTLKSPRPERVIDEESMAISGITAQTIFAGFNPQAPQLYPGRLPIAGKSPSSSFGLIGPESQKSIATSQDKAAHPPPDSEAEAILNEYLGQSGESIPAGWLPNPYNPSRPFPPLTAEEAKMPLSEYFAYRARQEEEAFLTWVEEKRMKPWLEAVDRGKLMVKELIAARKVRQGRTRDAHTHDKENKAELNGTRRHKTNLSTHSS
ncbi:hypothetical protein O181_063270 [Austropuccinia psidii MF-1]|uniref:BIR-domain-containing protein n=1 Tax=Austropuccinia psidii MF-1 TaxID=1389203 RepID=A0A9Q3I227_9BASI|nr:hypothetical protein [Austropuccinia psidii MF-1]